VYNHATPFVSPTSQSSPRRSYGEAGLSGDAPTVLIAEDSADTRAVLRHSLASCGYHVVEAADGCEAVEAARNECPDLIVMDLNMPVMDGLAATERIRGIKDRCGHVPIVAATAFDTTG
jgi:CheY-like chemotaxis protein